ncbi:hypothetical protein IPL85_01820 [Candidatus Saccharibacteria bacterium]|nr:MAG: hypothetical protein IPL85_01820 [Candidatus Saccharibacteria bacterium]
MKSRLSHISTSRKLALLVGVLLCLGIVIAILEKTGTTNILRMPQTAEQKKVTQQAEAEKKADTEAKQSFLDDSQKTTPSQDTPVSEPQPNQSNLNLDVKQEGETVTVLTKLSGVSSGECVLKAQNGSKSTEQQAQIIYQPEFSSCAGFNIAKSTLGVGQWQITLTVTTSSGQTLSQGQSLEVK